MAHQEAPTHPGIYQIRCKINGKIYIGSAINIRKRWKQHRLDLRCRKHHSRHLQRAWEKHGPDAFAFEVLQVMDNEVDLLRIEQEWLDRLKPFGRNGYNSCPTAGSRRGSTASEETRAKLSEIMQKRPKGFGAGWHHTPEAKTRIAEASKRRPRTPEELDKLREMARNPSPETRARISATQKGRKFSDEHIANLTAAQRRRTPDGYKKAGLKMKGRKLSPEHRAKISQAHKGRKFSPEVIAKAVAACHAKRRSHSPDQILFDFRD